MEISMYLRHRRFYVGIVAPHRISTVAIVLALMSASLVLADYKTDIGYTILTNAYAGVPNGSLAAVIQVEASETTNLPPPYAPNPGDAEFAGKSFTFYSGPAISSHATIVGRYFYGTSSSITPGVTNISNFQADDWIGGMLRVGTSNGPLSAAGFRVINESWIGSFAPLGTNFAYQTIRRTDAMVDRDGVTTVVGVNNGTATSIPQLLANAYNVIAVGNMASSWGPSTFDTLGRARPDIIAPLGFTSYATPVVGAAATLLTDSAILQGKTNALKPVVVKSLIMTGAEKLSGWHKGVASTNDDHTVPLDFAQGAGELQIDRSYTILQDPEAVIGATDNHIGWDFGSIAPSMTNFYYFNLGQGDFAATLNWNRHVPTFNTNQDSSVLNNLDFALYDYTGSTLGSRIDFSISAIDNVEHLYLTNLLTGAYALGVMGTSVIGTEDYGMSWMGVAGAAVPEPSSFLGFCGCAVLLRFLQSRRHTAAS